MPTLDDVIKSIIASCEKGEKTPEQARDEIVKVLDSAIEYLEAEGADDPGQTAP